MSSQLISPLADVIEATNHALTAVELARVLNVSKITIFKQARAGRIPSFRVGTCVRFDPHAIAKWLRGNTATKIAKERMQ